METFEHQAKRLMGDNSVAAKNAMPELKRQLEQSLEYWKSLETKLLKIDNKTDSMTHAKKVIKDIENALEAFK